MNPLCTKIIRVLYLYIYVQGLPVLDHVQGLEGADDVLVSDAGQVAAGEESGCGVR